MKKIYKQKKYTRKKYKVLFSCGSRPELIKLAPLYHHMKLEQDIEPILCLTGQHKDLVAPLLTPFDLQPDFLLDTLRPGQSLPELMRRLFRELTPVFEQISPHMLILQGDTSSALAAAIIGQKLSLKIAHVEAGLRTHDLTAPFPEEINRQTISKLSDWHFCPTQTARQNLLKENIADQKIFVTGNTVIDMVNKTRSKPLPPLKSIIGEKDWSRPYFLLTLHRRESLGSPLIRILSAIKDIAHRHQNFDIILPVHPNPQVKLAIREFLGDCDNICLTEPLSYPECIVLMSNAYAILTDSGGLQEEAPALNTPLLILRDKTERMEGVECGSLRLCGTEADKIRREVDLLIQDKAHYNRMCRARNPFGDGRASMRITAHLMDILKGRDIKGPKDFNDTKTYISERPRHHHP